MVATSSCSGVSKSSSMSAAGWLLANTRLIIRARRTKAVCEGPGRMAAAYVRRPECWLIVARVAGTCSSSACDGSLAALAGDAGTGGNVDPEVLKKAPLFARLDDEAATALSATMGTITLTKGEVLFHEGDAEDRLYVVVSGKIKLGRSGSAGRENLLAVLGPGQMFGELSLFDPGPRSTTATAVTPSELRTLEHDELMGWLTGRPEVAQGLLGQLAARLRRANDVVADMVFSDVPGRVAKQLLELAQRFGDRRDDGVHVHHDLTQEELAQLVGASRETVNKALADFAARGWIRLEPRSVTILDVDRVERRAR